LHSARADLIREASLIAWDEFTGANAAAIECANEVCQLIMGNTSAFGGIPFVALGDFRQVAPVVKGQGGTAALLASIKSSPLWQKFHTSSLHLPIRSAQDPDYTIFVDNIGEDYRHSQVPLPLLQTVHNLEDAIEFLYPSQTLGDPFTCLKRAFLSPKNVNVDTFNNCILG
jgi:hypothetical protein